MKAETGGKLQIRGEDGFIKLKEGLEGQFLINLGPMKYLASVVPYGKPYDDGSSDCAINLIIHGRVDAIREGRYWPPVKECTGCGEGFTGEGWVCQKCQRECCKNHEKHAHGMPCGESCMEN